MSNRFVKPILDAFDTILSSQFNSKIDGISSDTRYNWDTDHISLAMEPSPSAFPFIEVFPFGDSMINSQFRTGNTFDATWTIATVVNFVDQDAESLQSSLDLFLTSLIRAICSGSSGNEWTLNGNIDTLDLVRVSFVPPESQQGFFAGAGFAVWEASKNYDPTA